MRRYRIRLALLLALGSLVVASFAAAQQGGSAIRGRITDQQQGILPGVSIVVTHAESGTIRETVTGADGTYLVPGLVPGPYQIAAQLQGFSRLTQENLVLRIGVDAAGRSGAARRRDRRERHGHGRIAAGRSHLGAGRRQRVRGRDRKPAVGLAQLHRARVAAARRGLQPGGRLLVRQRHHQRPARQRRGVSDGRRQQQRRPARRQLGRAGAAAARSDSGVPGRHQPVRRRVRRRHRRRRQRGHQAGHQPLARQRDRLLHRLVDDRQGLLRRAAEPGQARYAQDPVGRHDRRADRPRQDAFLRQLRAPGQERGPEHRLSDASRRELHGRAGDQLLQLHGAARSPDERRPTTTRFASCGITSRTTTRCSPTAAASASAARSTR